MYIASLETLIILLFQDLLRLNKKHTGVNDDGSGTGTPKWTAAIISVIASICG